MVSTAFSRSILHTIGDDDPATNEINLNTKTTISVPSGVTRFMENAVRSMQSGAADIIGSLDILPEQTYSIDVGMISMWIDDGTNARLTGNSDTTLSKAAGASTFEQGEISLGRVPTTNQLTVQADNGDAVSFGAFITQEDASVVSFIEAWDTGDYVFGPQGKRLTPDSPQSGE